MDYTVKFINGDEVEESVQVNARHIKNEGEMIFFTGTHGECVAVFPKKTFVGAVAKKQEKPIVITIDYSQDIYPILTKVISRSNVQHLKIDDVREVITAAIAVLRQDPSLRQKIIG